MEPHDPHEPSHSIEPFGVLDSKRLPRPEVEELVVRALHDRGLLKGQTRLESLRGATRAARARSGVRVRTWLVGALAAGITFFAGERVGEHRSASASASAIARSGAVALLRPEQVTELVRSSADNYVSALALVQPEQPAARAAAIRSFRTAADQMLRLAPESDIALAIRIAFPTSFAESPYTLVAASQRRVIWF